jgi:hypothetical protein
MHSPILGSSYVTRSVNAADNRMVNLFPEVIPEGGKEPAFLNRAPGLRFLLSAGVGPIRGLWQLGGYMFAVSANQLYKVDSTWTAIPVGYVAGTGPVSIADNGTQIFFACNGPSYIYDISTNIFVQITDPDFPGAVTVGYLDGYFVFNEPNSQKVWVTELLDGTNIDSLAFASAEGSPDGLVSLIVDHREAWLFGTNSVEVWYDAGTIGFPLARVQGAYNEIGCIAPYSVAKLDNGIFWLGADARGKGIVYRANGYTGVRVSTHAVEWHIQEYSTLADATAYTYQQDGHAFYVLNFPSGRTTWVYDVATQSWHERAYWDNGAFTRHLADNQVFFNNTIVVGDWNSGNIYALDLDYYADNNTVQRWLRSWRALPTGTNNLKRTRHDMLQLDCEVGVGVPGTSNFTTETVYLTTEAGDHLTTESGDSIILASALTIGVNPQAMLRWSDDGGHTWSNEHWRDMGPIGSSATRVIWRRLGMTQKSRDRVYELSGTDPVKIAIVGAELAVTPTNA